MTSKINLEDAYALEKTHWYLPRFYEEYTTITCSYIATDRRAQGLAVAAGEDGARAAATVRRAVRVLCAPLARPALLPAAPRHSPPSILLCRPSENVQLQLQY